LLGICFFTFPSQFGGCAGHSPPSYLCYFIDIDPIIDRDYRNFSGGSFAWPQLDLWCRSKEKDAPVLNGATPANPSALDYLAASPVGRRPVPPEKQRSA
jgi:hypothetical protein